ncbi:unnamed protein product [Effrenium voratum]|uniref:Uncharacterized protein n=1 Tax=Effrenium voratum TaxID=2562239 RepID=A0AA36J9I2_9DINO|nr:unnamed protein product [Effrenium voratum]
MKAAASPASSPVSSAVPPSPSSETFYVDLNSPSGARLPSPKKAARDDAPGPTPLFAALSSPSNLVRPSLSQSPKRRPLQTVSEEKAPAAVPSGPTSPTSPAAVAREDMCCTLSSKELNELPGTCAAEDAPVPAERASGNERPRKKKGVRPPTLELERYLPEEEDLTFASPSKSPSKSRAPASSSFAPAWLQERGTPAHAERLPLESLPPQPSLPAAPPPTPGPVPPSPLPPKPAPPPETPDACARQGLRRGASRVSFPSVPPSPSAGGKGLAQAPNLSLPTKPELPPAPDLPAPPRHSRSSEAFEI